MKTVLNIQPQVQPQQPDQDTDTGVANCML